MLLFVSATTNFAQFQMQMQAIKKSPKRGSLIILTELGVELLLEVQESAVED